jgi:predicted nucleotidyltransferase
MTSILKENQAKIAAICQRLRVERLDVFGSAVRNDFDATVSDLDFVVRFLTPHDRGYADRYLELAEALEKVFARRVDVLTERSLRNPILKQAIARDRRTLYGS